MRALVTGAGGFIGSSLAGELVAEGHEVVALDRLSDYYDPRIKRTRMKHLEQEGCEVIPINLLHADLAAVLRDVDWVFHLAGQPGVRKSWGNQFDIYAEDNVMATQVLLEAARNAPKIKSIVYASSSSVYGENPEFPFTEATLPMPKSPYGVTKLAGEHLMSLYGKVYGLPTVSLRYFTVYGPGQRPDMAIYRMIEMALHEQLFVLYGDGTALRDFTYVDDVVRATIAAAYYDLPAGEVINIGGGHWVSMADLMSSVYAATGVQIVSRVLQDEDAPGDVSRTGADASRAKELLDWQPQMTLDRGINVQVAWHMHNAAVRV